MAKYTFVSEDDLSDDNRHDCQSVTFDFDADTLDEITEKFFWFIRAAGFNYVDEVKVGNFTFSA